MRRLILAMLGAFAVAVPALGQDDGDVDALRDAVAAVNAACAANVDAPACTLATLEATPRVTTALATIGETRDRATYGAAMRAYLDARPAEIRAAAAFALAQLFPDADDTPTLLRLLQEAVPGVRLAALAALRASSDPAARILVARAGTIDAVQFRPQRPPYDPAALGVVLPGDVRYVQFERDEVDEGALLFSTVATPAAVLQELLAQGGHDPFNGEALPGWLGESEAGPPLRTFVGQSDSFADVAGIVLEGDPAGARDQRMRIALVYRDLQLDRTGIALLWPPPNRIPAPPSTPAPAPTAGASEPLPDDALELPDAATLGVQPDADPDDTALYLMVRAAHGAGGDDYLAMFPDGTYRKAVALLLATELIVEPDATRVAPGAAIVVRFRNMPGNPKDWLSIMPAGARDDDYERFTFTDGAKDGSVTLTAPNAPGDYEIRAYFDNSYTVERRIPVIVDADADTVETVPAATPQTATATNTPVLSLVGAPEPRAPITVHYAGLPGTASDWIAIAPEGSADGVWAAWSKTDGHAEGQIALAGQPPGRYEIRAYAESPMRTVIARLPLIVAAAVRSGPPTMTVEGTPTAGAPLVIHFSGMPDVSGSWVSIVPLGTPETAWGTYVYAPTGPEGAVTLPGQPAGRYVVRFFVEEPARSIIVRLAVGIQ